MHTVLGAVLLATGGALLQTGPAQPSAPAKTAERSHVERFANPRARAAADERAATEAVKKNPDDVEALAARGYARLQLRDLNGALADFRRAADLAPGTADLHTAAGYVLMQLRRSADAKAAFERALAIEPEQFLAHYHLGRMLLLAGGDPREAARHLERALVGRPDYSEIRFDLLTAYRLAGERDLASAQLRYLREVRPRDPRVRYGEGLLALDAGDLPLAIERLRSVVETSPQLVGAVQDLALAYVRAGRWTDAEPLLARLVAADGRSVEATYLHALSLFNLGRVGEAEAAVRALRDRGVKSAAVDTLYGIVLAARSAPSAEVVAAFRSAAALDPKSFDAHFYLGRALYAARGYDAAAAAFRDALRINPAHVQARFFLATALEDGGKSEEALAEYGELAVRAPESPEGFVGRGQVLVNKGSYEEALVALRRAVGLDPKLYEAQFALGRALARSGKAEEAVAAFRAATALEPARVAGHYQLAQALRRAGHEDEAAAELREVERLNTEFRMRSGGMGGPDGGPAGPQE